MTAFVNMADYGFHRTIKYRGLFDLEGLYKYVHQWITSHDFDYFEPQAHDRPPYTIYKMWGRKKVTYFVMLLLNVEIWVWNRKDVDVIKAGEKKKMTEARLKIIVNGGYMLDYDGDFEKSPFLKKVETFLHDHVMYHDILLKYFDYMDYYLYDFLTDLKKFLGMQTSTNAY